MIECKCGYAFPESLGKYGCPNCEGEIMVTPKSANERKSNERRRKRAQGFVLKQVWIKKGKSAELAAAVDRINSGEVMSIDWKNMAEENGLTPEEFRKEIFSVAACLGAMDLDREERAGDTVKFTTSFGGKKIHVYVKYA